MGATPASARKRRVTQIEELAARQFKNHFIEQELDRGVFRSFRCYTPGSACYSFRLITVPGRLIVLGDIGHLIVERIEDMFEWAPDAVESIEYFAEKVPGCLVTREYDREVADEWINEQLAGDSCKEFNLECKSFEGFLHGRRGTFGVAEMMNELRQWIDNGPELKSLLHSSGYVDGCDFPDFTNWTPNFLWCRESVRWFFNNWRSQ